MLFNAILVYFIENVFKKKYYWLKKLEYNHMETLKIFWEENIVYRIYNLKHCSL